MSKVSNVCIGIQARSTSERLPNKVEMDINGRTMLERVIYNCQNSASFVNGDKRRTIRVSTALLIPEGDPIGQKYSHRITVIEGDEQDVLSRYVDCARSLNVDYMVRVTADCPLLPAKKISQHIVTACKYKHDYVTNTIPECRMDPDGFDVEVVSRKLLEYLDNVATTPFHREHVTTHLKEVKPVWASYYQIPSEIDASQLKLSVDTLPELEYVRAYHRHVVEKLDIKKRKYDRH